MLAAALLLGVITVLVRTRLDLFTGAALAVRIRRNRPDVYARLATSDVDSV